VPPRRPRMAVSAYVLIQIEMGKAGDVAGSIANIDGVVSADIATGPYDIIAKASAETMDDLGRMVVGKIEMVDGITRTLTCPIINL
jgi:DNA-binding Lrp family transcriptional regulator